MACRWMATDIRKYKENKFIIWLNIFNFYKILLFVSTDLFWNFIFYNIFHQSIISNQIKINRDFIKNYQTSVLSFIDHYKSLNFKFNK